MSGGVAITCQVRFRTAIYVPEQIALTAPALPVPTASTKQENNHDDNQNRF
jgi:hypothetical protein